MAERNVHKLSFYLTKSLLMPVNKHFMFAIQNYDLLNWPFCRLE